MRKDSKKFIDCTFALDVENRLKEYGLSECCKVIVPETSVSDLDPVVLFVEYNSVLQTKMQYIPERVKVDINETEIFNLYPEVLETLLKDHTTGRNIFWATDSYAHRGDGFQYSDAITVGHIIGENGMVI